MPVFETDRETIFLGSSDLCLAGHIPELVKSGIASLKVEGRMKSEYYVATVARVYRAALDSYAADPEGFEVCRLVTLQRHAGSDLHAFV